MLSSLRISSAGFRLEIPFGCGCSRSLISKGDAYKDILTHFSYNRNLLATKIEENIFCGKTVVRSIEKGDYGHFNTRVVCNYG